MIWLRLGSLVAIAITLTRGSEDPNDDWSEYGWFIDIPEEESEVPTKTDVVVPVLYYLFDSLTRWFGNRPGILATFRKEVEEDPAQAASALGKLDIFM